MSALSQSHSQDQIHMLTATPSVVQQRHQEGGQEVSCLFGHSRLQGVYPLQRSQPLTSQVPGVSRCRREQEVDYGKTEQVLPQLPSFKSHRGQLFVHLLCRTCHTKHHTLLHKDEEADKKQTSTSLLTTAKTVTPSPPRLLPRGFIHTALVTIYNGDRWQTVRAAVDTCCSSSVMTERVASHLKVKRLPINVEMSGAVATTTLTQSATIGVRPLNASTEKLQLDVAIMPKPLSSTPPADQEDLANHPKFRELPLADREMGGTIDLIIGARAHPKVILEKPIKTCEEFSTIAMPTIFGYTLGGASTPDNSSALTTLQVELKEDHTLDHLLTHMWQLETVPTAPTHSPEEEVALLHFDETVKVEEDGRYTVSLPRVTNPPALGKSRKMALSRFLGNKRSLLRRGKLQAFNQEMDSYISLQHAELVPDSELEYESYYLPVHGVFKEHSTTTKVRPVFDGSAKTSSGVSFNEQLLAGPSLLPNIADVLLPFRLHRIAFSADISKMFREIQLHPSERNYHRFLL